MTGHPADGERGAVRGYQWQYDHAAALVYDAIRDRVFNRLRLVDSAAGGVDDLVLVREGWTDAYQFRSSEHPGSITFNRLVRPQRGQSLSTISVLAQGWQQLRERWPGVRVHFVAQQYASTSDRLPGEDGRSPGHFSALLRQVLVPVRTGNLDLNGRVSARWQPALAKLRRGQRTRRARFWGLCGVIASRRRDTVGVARPRSPSGATTSHRCLARFNDVLLRRQVSSNWTQTAFLDLMDWSARTRLRRRHEFPVDPRHLRAAYRMPSMNCETILDSRDRGYVALVGPPGFGQVHIAEPEAHRQHGA